jgi:peptide/nickel transport system ATP-binding protein
MLFQKVWNIYLKTEHVAPMKGSDLVMAESLLEVRGLKTYFFDKGTVFKAVDGVDFTIGRGETLGIVGESGCGKSMTSLSIMQLVPKPKGKIVEGQILLEGKDLVPMNNEQVSAVRGNDIAMIFQEPMTALNPVLTIGDQISETLILHQKMSKANARAKAIEMLKKVGFPRAEQIVDEYPHQLSGGMRQRAMIAMAMANNPKLLIADEPTTALDVTIQAQVLDLMRDLQKEYGTSIMLITHDLGVVAEMADRVVVMYAGQVVETTDVTTLFEQPKHPYTNGLLESIPMLDEDKERLSSIKGQVPSASNFPVGCRFADRCPKAQASCYEKMPELREVAPGHFVRCDLV